MILGVTGGIGSGKSSVSRLLACYCLAPLIDLDQSCRHLLDTGQAGWQALHTAFAGTFELPDGRINRPLLREKLFQDASFRQEVDALLHPLALARMREEVEVMRKQAALILIEIPLLYEAGWQRHVDAVLVVYARRAVQCCRLMQRDGISRKQARQALAAQMDLGEKASLADYVIDNSTHWALTRKAVIALGDRLGPELLQTNALHHEKVLDSSS